MSRVGKTSHEFLFQRSPSELRYRFEHMEKHALLFCGIVLDQVDDTVVTAKDIRDGNLSMSLRSSALYKALQRIFPNTIPTTTNATTNTTLNAVDDDNGDRFSRFLDSVLESALAVLQNAADKHTAGDDYRDHFCPCEPIQVERSISWIRGILANAFLGNIVKDPVRPRKDWGGGLDLRPILWSTSIVAVEKICCFIQYFLSTDPQIMKPDVIIDNDSNDTYNNYMNLFNPLQRKVVFQKVSMTDDEFLSALQRRSNSDQNKSEGNNTNHYSSTADISSGFAIDDTTVVHDGAMEIGTVNAFVNFANSNFGYGKFIASCTQEEILQVCCPEMNVGMLFYGSMDDDTLILTHNVRRFSVYSGYLKSFAFKGPCDCSVYNDQTIITMDASFSKQYTNEGNLRDMKKAFLGWKSCLDWHCRSTVTTQHDVDGGFEKTQKKIIQISTGQWGCGVFGGVVIHKYLQQVNAALLTNCHNNDATVQLFFSCFHDLEMKEMLEKLRLYGVSPWSVYNGILLGESRSTFSKGNIDNLVARMENLGKDDQAEEANDCDIVFTSKNVCQVDTHNEDVA